MDTYPPFKVSGSEQDDNDFMKCYLSCGTPKTGGRPRNDSQYLCWTNCRLDKDDRLFDDQAGGHKRKKRTRRIRKTRRKKRKTRRKKRKTRRKKRKTRRRRHMRYRRRRRTKRIQRGGYPNPQVGDVVYFDKDAKTGEVTKVITRWGGREPLLKIQWATGEQQSDVRAGGGGGGGGGGAHTGSSILPVPASSIQLLSRKGRDGGGSRSYQLRQPGGNRPIEFTIIAHGNGEKIGSIRLQDFPKLVAISNAAPQGCVASGGFAKIERAVANPSKGYDHLGGLGNPPLPPSIDDIGFWCHCCHPLTDAEVAALDGKSPQCSLSVPATHGGPKVVPGKCESADCNDQYCMWMAVGCDPWAGIFVKTGVFPNSKLKLINPAPTGQAVYDKYTLSRALHDIQQYMKSNYNGTRTWQVYIHTCRGHRQNPHILAIQAKQKELNKQIAPLLKKVVVNPAALSDEEFKIFMALNTELSKLHEDWLREQ